MYLYMYPAPRSEGCCPPLVSRTASHAMAASFRGRPGRGPCFVAGRAATDMRAAQLGRTSHLGHARVTCAPPVFAPHPHRVNPRTQASDLHPAGAHVRAHDYCNVAIRP